MKGQRTMVAYRGETHCLAEWARLLGLDYRTVKRRHAEGLPPEQTLHIGKLPARRSGQFYPAVSVGNGRTEREHILVAERALGRPLPPGAEVHHLDEDKTNNAPSNLVICPDTAYHRLLHARARALRESGNANNRQCRFCKQWDEPKNLAIYSQKSAAHHKCAAEYQRARRAAIR